MLSSVISAGALLLALLSAPSLASCTPGCNPKANSAQHREKILKDYFKLWDGEYNLLNTTLSPKMSIHVDRFPNNGTSYQLEIKTREDFAAFIKRSRTGWQSYTFDLYKTAGEGFNVAIRWTMRGILGEGFNIIDTPLKPGSPVTYNGTEFLILNECTGLVDEVDSAQDLIQLFHDLKLTSVTV